MFSTTRSLFRSSGTSNLIRHQFSSSTRTSSRSIPASTAPTWIKAGAFIGAVGTAYTLWEYKPELLPQLPELHAEAPPQSLTSSDTYLDPTTKIPFPRTLIAPSGTPLKLVGTGVRKVSFLSIKVYTCGFYVSEGEFEEAKRGQLGGWKGYTPERLLKSSIHNVPERERDELMGEKLIESLLEKADAAVVIVPLRNTSLPHLRDGFSRALVARMKVPSVAEAFDEQVSERTGAALVAFKSFFPSKSLAKGEHMELFYSAVDRSVLFRIRETNSLKPTDLGTLNDGLLASQLMVSYFSDTNAPSEELRQSVAMGFAGEER